MGKNVIIVESPAKAKTIERYLGRSYKVTASLGHVRDLPKSKLGVDIEQEFAPQYITIRGKGKVLAELRKVIKGAKNVYLATDPDREGEAIAWHLLTALDLPHDTAMRIVFNEITESAIKGAIASPRAIDQPLVDAQQARRVLDRLVGYKLSPLLWRKVRRGLSAGRVQSSTVKMIVDRERERDAFVPREYWTVEGEFSAASQSISANLARYRGEEPEIPSQAAMEALLSELPEDGYVVRGIEQKESKRYPSAPFTTSSMQQEASRRLGMRGSTTMRIAQQLYEGLSLSGSSEHTGLITYMRTDASRVSSSAVESAADYILSTYGKDYSQPTTQRGRVNKDAQDAHEAVRPTDVRRTPDAVKGDLTRPQHRLYKLIWERFVASQMTPARFDETLLTLAAGEFEFEAKGKIQRFDGFLVLGDSDGRDNDHLLPELQEGAPVELIEILPKQNFTQPPGRYTEASLVRALEEERIGRPSTYAPIIDTIQKRDYVATENKQFYPTELGILVNDLLEEYFEDIVDLKFTAQVEDKLDEIEDGELDWVEVVKEFYQPFAEDLSRAEEELDRVEIPEEETDEICEKCGRTMVIKYGRFGKFIACPGYPECKNSKPYVEKTGAHCPECGSEVVKRQSKRGRVFYGCSGYPDCKFVVWNEPSSTNCPECDAFMIKKRSKKKGNYLQCSRESCKFELHPSDGMDV